MPILWPCWDACLWMKISASWSDLLITQCWRLTKQLAASMQGEVSDRMCDHDWNYLRSVEGLLALKMSWKHFNVSFLLPLIANTISSKHPTNSPLLWPTRVSSLPNNTRLRLNSSATSSGRFPNAPQNALSTSFLRPFIAAARNSLWIFSLIRSLCAGSPYWLSSFTTGPRTQNTINKSPLTCGVECCCRPHIGRLTIWRRLCIVLSGAVRGKYTVKR